MQTQSDLPDGVIVTRTNRVLLVEDDNITNEVIQFYLKDHYIVDIAITEQQAISYLKLINTLLFCSI